MISRSKKTESVARKTYGSLSLALFLDLPLDVLPDGQLDRALANLGEIGSGEPFGNASQVIKVDLFGNRGLSQVGAENRDSARLVGKWDVDQLIETAWTKDGRIDDVRPVKKKRSVLQ